MIVDTSAIVCILAAEQEAKEVAASLAAAATRHMSAASYLETAIVIESRHGMLGGKKLDQFIQSAQITIVPVTVERANIARLAYRNYGKGRHSAGLNYGDCFAYALAKVLGESLLYLGDDFAQTDITPAIASDLSKRSTPRKPYFSPVQFANTCRTETRSPLTEAAENRCAWPVSQWISAAIPSKDPRRCGVSPTHL